jgi:hypothetical protein
MRILAGLTPGLVLAAVVQAQGTMTGKWLGTTRNGSEIVLALKAVDEKLTGTVTRNGEPATIMDGKISGSTLTFRATLGEQTESVTGELAGEELKVWLDRQGREAAVVLKRVKE